MFLRGAPAPLCGAPLRLSKPCTLAHHFHLVIMVVPSTREDVQENRGRVFKPDLRVASQCEGPGGSLNRLNGLLLPERGGVPACCLLPAPALAATMHGSGTRLVLLWAGSRCHLRNRADSEKQKSHSSICLAGFSSPYPGIYDPKSDFSLSQGIWHVDHFLQLYCSEAF